MLANPYANAAGLVIAGQATGDVLYASSAIVWARLPVGSNGAMLTVNAGIPAWSTATWPATTTVSQLLYSSSANVVAGLATANSGVFTTSATGVPSILALTAGSVLFGATTGVSQDPTNFSWDGTNHQLILGDGSNTYPVITFASQPTMGIYRGGTDNLFIRGNVAACTTTWYAGTVAKAFISGGGNVQVGSVANIELLLCVNNAAVYWQIGTAGHFTTRDTNAYDIGDAANTGRPRTLYLGTSIDIGKASVATGLMKLSGTTSGTVTATVAAAAGTWTFTLPTTGGTNNYVLTTNGSGTTTWTDASTVIGGYVSSITGTANQVIASASTGAVTLSLPQSIATSSTPQFSALGLGGAAGSASTLKITGTASGSVAVAVAATVGGDYTITLPKGSTDFSATGGAGQVVQQASAGAAFTVAPLASTSLSDVVTWVAVTFDAAMFTAASGNWTVAAGDVQDFSYAIIGKLMIVSLILNTTTVSATPASLSVTIPAGKTAARLVGNTFQYYEGVAVSNGFCQTSAGGTTIIFNKTFLGVNWLATTDGTYIYAEITFPIQ